MQKREISIIGAGLAGSEAALILADRGWQVQLYEMRPYLQTPAHQSGDPAELVCSNSLKSLRLDTASGLLKEELKLLGCRLLDIALQCSVPAGHALAVNRQLFSQKVAAAIENSPNIQLIRQEITELPTGKVIIASGPLTSDKLMQHLASLVGDSQLFFFDAIAPIIDADSLDYSRVYAKARYDKGEADYLNCAFDKDEYYAFVDALLAGEKYQVHEFEDEFFSSDRFEFYENCMPIEELARRGKDTLRHGVMRPMGLEVPATGQKAFAVLQLRAENTQRSAYNIVGGQSMLRYPEQKRIFRLIPGLEQAEFLRFGSIHRNGYLNSPNLLLPNLQLKLRPDTYLAGQLSGVEGYMESVASGLLNALVLSEDLPLLPPESVLGQLWRRLISPPEKRGFQPVNANFALLPALDDPPRDKKLKKELLSQRSLAAMQEYLNSIKPL